MARIKFYIDYDEDLENILFRLTSVDPAGLDYRVKKKGLDKQVVESILAEEDFGKQEQILEEYLREVYKDIRADLEKVELVYEDIWQDKEDDFFKLSTEIMGDLPWDYDNYFFLISAFYSMASWGGTNQLAVWYKREPRKHYYMNGYELILSHFFETVDRLYDKRPVSDWHIWALAEITAHILTLKEEKMISSLWPQMNTLIDTPIEDDISKGSYPHLAEHAKKVWQIYQNRKGYDDYVNQSIDYIKDASKESLKRE